MTKMRMINRILKLIAVMALCIVSFSLLIQTAKANELPQETDVKYTTTDREKVWTIHFSDYIDRRTVTNETLHVVDSNGRKVLLDPIVIEDRKIMFQPVNPYPYGIYTAYLKADFKSVKGNPIGQDMRFTFKVEDPDNPGGDDKEQADATVLQGIKANPIFIELQLQHEVADLTLDDVQVAGVLGPTKVPVTLESIDAEAGLIFYSIPEGYKGQTIELFVSAAEGSTKLQGAAVTQFYYGDGLYGRVTNEQGEGIEDATVMMNLQYEMMGSAVATETFKNGHYFLEVPYAANWDGEVQAKGYEKQFVLTTVHDSISQNEFNVVLKEDRRHLKWSFDITWDGGQQANRYPTKMQSRAQLLYAAEVDADASEYEDVFLSWGQTSYHGPSRTNIGKLKNGRYLFVIHDGYGETNIANSTFTIKKYKGSHLMETETVAYPAEDQPSTKWTFFELIVSEDGEHIEFNRPNTIQYYQ